MKLEEIIVGARVRCLYSGTNGKYYGKSATITQAMLSGLYRVEFDEASRSSSWSEPKDFELLVNVHYTVKGISRMPHDIIAYPTPRGYECWISETDACYKESKMRARYQDINQAYTRAAKYNGNNHHRSHEWQFVVEETD